MASTFWETSALYTILDHYVLTLCRWVMIVRKAGKIQSNITSVPGCNHRIFCPTQDEVALRNCLFGTIGPELSYSRQDNPSIVCWTCTFCGTQRITFSPETHSRRLSADIAAFSQATNLHYMKFFDERKRLFGIEPSTMHNL